MSTRSTRPSVIHSSPEALFLFLLPFGRPRGRFAMCVSCAALTGALRLLLTATLAEVAVAVVLLVVDAVACVWGSLPFPFKRRSFRYLSFDKRPDGCWKTGPRTVKFSHPVCFAGSGAQAARVLRAVDQHRLWQRRSLFPSAERFWPSCLYI